MNSCSPEAFPRLQRDGFAGQVVGEPSEAEAPHVVRPTQGAG